MPKSMLGLMSVVDAYDGPWQRVNGMKMADVRVAGLAPDEGVKIEFEERTTVGLQLGAFGLGLGTTEVDMTKWERFRLCKTTRSCCGREATFAEVFPRGEN